METGNERTRHLIVTIWLWASIVGNLLGIISFVYRANTYQRPSTFELVIAIAIIAGNVLIMKWKPIGPFINFAAIIALSVFLVFNNGIRPLPSIGLGAVMVLAQVGIFSIRKNGVSTWKHLLNEANANKKRTKTWFAAVFGSILAILLMAAFPVKIMYGNVIVLFAPERIVRPSLYTGRVLGRHVLGTEHGEVRIRPFANMTMLRGFGTNDQLGIEYEDFLSGRTSHNLVVEGIQMPRNLTVWFSYWFTQGTVARLGVHDDLIVSGITVAPNDWKYIHTSANLMTFEGWSLPNLVLSVRFANDYITLADSTELDVSRFTGDLLLWNDDGKWELFVLKHVWLSRLGVRQPGETEFTLYRSITFKPNWGAFIGGELEE